LIFAFWRTFQSSSDLEPETEKGLQEPVSECKNRKGATAARFVCKTTSYCRTVANIVAISNRKRVQRNVEDAKKIVDIWTVRGAPA